MDNAHRQSLFQTMMDDHGAAIRRLCKGYERSPALQEELEQEVLLSLWRALPSFRGRPRLEHGCTELRITRRRNIVTAP